MNAKSIRLADATKVRIGDSIGANDGTSDGITCRPATAARPRLRLTSGPAMATSISSRGDLGGSAILAVPPNRCRSMPLMARRKWRATIA